MTLHCTCAQSSLLQFIAVPFSLTEGHTREHYTAHTPLVACNHGYCRAPACPGSAELFSVADGECHQQSRGDSGLLFAGEAIGHPHNDSSWGRLCCPGPGGAEEETPRKRLTGKSRVGREAVVREKSRHSGEEGRQKEMRGRRQRA